MRDPWKCPVCGEWNAWFVVHEHECAPKDKPNAVNAPQMPPPPQDVKPKEYDNGFSETCAEFGCEICVQNSKKETQGE